MSLLTALTKINAGIPGEIDTEINAVSVVGASRVVSLTMVGGVSLDSAALRLPDGANRVFWTPGTAALAGTVAALLEMLLEYAVEIEGTTNQITFTADEFGNLTGSLPQDIATNSAVQFKEVIVRNFAGSNNPPSVVSFGNGAGASFTPDASVVSGDNMQFQLNLTPSAAPVGAFANLVTFAFQVTYLTPPRVLIIPVGRTTSSLQAGILTSCAIGGITETGFTVTVGNTPLTAGVAYSWAFIVIGR